MIVIPRAVRVYFAIAPVNLRKSFEGLFMRLVGRSTSPAVASDSPENRFCLSYAYCSTASGCSWASPSTLFARRSRVGLERQPRANGLWLQ